jgi:hypothetical protein
MGSRLELHTELTTMLGNDNVYYQPPESKKMEYPAIKYSKTTVDSKFADNRAYSNMRCYQLIVIDPKPDNPVIDKLLEMTYCKHNTHYVANGLNHDILTLFY